MKHGYVHLSNVGNIKIRGKARIPGTVKTAEVQHKGGQWFLSVTLFCEPRRTTQGVLAGGIDWGVETFATVVTNQGDTIKKAYQRPKC